MGGTSGTAIAHTLLRPTVAPGRTRGPNSCYPPPPPVGGSAIREVRGPVEETHKSSYITGSNDFACVRGQEIYLSKPFRSILCGSVTGSLVTSVPAHFCHYFMPR